MADNDQTHESGQTYGLALNPHHGPLTCGDISKTKMQWVQTLLLNQKRKRKKRKRGIVNQASLERTEQTQETGEPQTTGAHKRSRTTLQWSVLTEVST